MKKYIPVIIALMGFVLNAHGVDLISEMIYREDYRIDSSRYNQLRFSFRTLSFFENNEFNTGYVKGYTLPGFRMSPRLVYYAAENVKLETGAHLLSYWGAQRYPVAGYKDIPEWNLNKNKTTLLKSGIDNIVIKELSQLSKYERAELSDWLELAMNRNYPLGFGHGVSYHKSGSKSGIELTSKEIFAEITSAYVASPDSLAVMKKYFPETVNAYDILIKSIVK